MCFHFSLHYKSEKTMQTEDSLLQRPNYEKKVEFDNRDQILLKPEVFANLLQICAIDAFYNTSINDNALFNNIKKTLLFDKVTQKYQQLLKTEFREFNKFLEKWNFENELLLFREHIYISKASNEKFDLKHRIVQLHHDLSLAEHFRK